MSIYASLDAPDAWEHEHEPLCAALVETTPMICELSGKPCTCRCAPLKYHHSGRFPDEADRAEAAVDLAMIPSHISKDGKDENLEDGPPHPYLRFGVHDDGGGATVILTEAQVRKVHDQLSWWLRARMVGIAAAQTPPPDESGGDGNNGGDDVR